MVFLYNPKKIRGERFTKKEVFPKPKIAVISRIAVERKWGDKF